MAIIVVLAAVAIPTFGRQLETARETGDMEIVRSAYTEALSVAILDASDGVLDGVNGNGAASSPIGTTLWTATTGVVSGFTAVAATGEGATATPPGGKYTVTLANMDAQAKFKQTGTGWQFVNAVLQGNVLVPAVTQKTATITFEFELPSTGNVRLKADTVAGTASSITVADGT